MADGPVIALAAGGTGGHLFPAEAVAAALLRRGARPVLVTDARGGSFSGSLGDAVPVVRIAAGSPGGSLGRTLQAVLGLGVSYLRAALAILPGRRVEAVIGFGGYASVPTALAARHRGHRIVLVEANAYLGRANRFLAKAGCRIAAGFPILEGVPMAARPGVVVTGVPVRPALAALHTAPRPNRRPDGRLSLLVTGGSQGAAAFSRLVPPALAHLPLTLRRGLFVQHQARAEDAAAVSQALAAAEILHEVRPFFTDMADRLAGADIAIGRAGAGTVMEAATAGCPIILIPLPTATDDHQTVNAHAAADLGAAAILPQADATPIAFSALIRRLLEDGETRAAMTQAGRTRLAKPQAAEAIADLVLNPPTLSLTGAAF